MQEWLDNNDILMYSTHHEGQSVIAEMFIKTSKAKINKLMTANDRKSYLSYLNKLVINTVIHILILLIKNVLVLIILIWL